METIRLIGITGAGGYGKSTLAAKLYSDVPGFSHKFWVSFNQPYSFSQWGQSILKQFNIELNETASDEEIALVLSRQLAKERCLLVLDNLEALLTEAALWQPYQQFLQKWVDRNTRSVVLVTSREQPQLSLLASKWYPLAGLSLEAGVALLQSLEVQGTVDDLQEMVQLTDGHPLLIKLTVGWLRQERGEAAEVGYILSKPDLNLLTDIVGGHRDDPEISVGKVLEQMMVHLEPRLQELWLSLSVYRQPFGEAQAQVMLRDAALADLRLLARRSLLQEQPTSSSWQFSFLPLLKTFAQQQLDEPTTAHEQAVEYYSSMLQPEPWKTIEDIVPNLEIFHHYCVLGEYNLAFDTLHACQEFLSLRGYNKILIETYQQLVQKWDLREDNESDFISIFAVLGDAYNQIGQFQKSIAHHKVSLEIAQASNDLEGESGALINLGWVYSSINQYKRAIQCNLKGLRIAKSIDRPDLQANALKHLGIAYQRLGRYQMAIKYHQKSLDLEIDIEDEKSISGSLINLGNLYRFTSLTQSIDLLYKGIRLARKFGNCQYEANGWGSLGLAYNDLNQYKKAVICYLNALKIYQQIEDRHGEYITLNNLGNAYSSLNQTHCALEYRQQALKIVREIESQ